MLKNYAGAAEQIHSLSCEQKHQKSESEIAQLCLTLCDPMDCSLPGCFIHWISRQEYWSGLPFPSTGDLSKPGIEPRCPALWADALPSEPQESLFKKKKIRALRYK